MSVEAVAVFRVGVIGYGHWAKDLRRHFENNPKFLLVRIAERDDELRALARRAFPSVDIVAEESDLCSDADIDVVVIAKSDTRQQAFAAAATANGKRVIAGAGIVTRRHSKAVASRGGWLSAGIPTALYCGFIYYLSSRSDLGSWRPEWFNFPNADKVAHVILFGGLAGIVAFDLFRWKRSTLDADTLFVVPAWIAALYGVTDEIHQRFVAGRTFEWIDMGADAIGAFAVAGALAAGYSLLNRAAKSR